MPSESNKEFLLRILGNSPQPLSIGTLRRQGMVFDEVALWDAVDQGEIELTSDWCLRLTATEGRSFDDVTG